MIGWILLLVACLGAALLLGGALLAAAGPRQRARARLLATDAEVSEPTVVVADFDSNRLRYWLYRAGFRNPAAPTLFLFWTGISLVLGIALASMTAFGGFVEFLTAGLAQVPPGISDLLVPFAYAAPAMIGLIVASVPILVVRSARRRRVKQLEQDLPLALDLLATLAEAGLGFDAALERMLEAQSSERALASELRLFQVEVLAGRSRVQALRRLGRRIDLAPFSVFISAMVQAEQVGSGVAEVLRMQAEDARQRRREAALAAAMSAPVKQLVPLVLCFMPGIVLAAVGPSMYQFFQFVDAFIRPIQGR